MEEFEMLDAPDRTVHKKTLWTIRFLITSLSSIVLTFLISWFKPTFFFSFGDRSSFTIMLNVIAVVSALAGFIMGFTERSYNKKSALLGIIGNGIILAIYITFAVIAIYVLTHLNY